MSDKKSMKFEQFHHQPSTEQEPIREASVFKHIQQKLGELQEEVSQKFNALCDLYSSAQETSESAQERDVDLQRRRFVTALGAGALLTSPMARSLEKLDPYWEKFQIARKRLEKSSDSSLNITNFLCDSESTHHPCFDTNGNRLTDINGEPLIDIPYKEWHVNQDVMEETQEKDSTPALQEDVLNIDDIVIVDGKRVPRAEFDKPLESAEDQPVKSSKETEKSSSSDASVSREVSTNPTLPDYLRDQEKRPGETSEAYTQRLQVQTEARQNTPLYKAAKAKERTETPITLTESERAQLRAQVDPYVKKLSTLPENLQRLSEETTKRLGESAIAQRAIKRYSKRYGVPQELIKAVIAQESAGNAKAVNTNSACAGYMGVAPIASRAVGRNVMDHLVKNKKVLTALGSVLKGQTLSNEEQSILSREHLAIKNINHLDVMTTYKTLNTITQEALNIAGGTHYLAKMFQQFKTLEKALIAYNAGQKYVDSPPKETLEYVHSVTSMLHEFSK